MYLPMLDGIETQKDVVTEFGGYNHNLRISAAEFYHMENMTSAYSPAPVSYTHLA